MRRRWFLPVLTVVMGMQLLRVFIPSLAWYLRDSVGLSSFSLAPYAFGTFLFGFLAAPLRRMVGSRSAVRISTIGVVALRLLEQVSTNPEYDLWLSIYGVAMFVLFLPLYLGHLRAAGKGAATLWGYGLPLGLATDIALHGASGTLDLTWIDGILPIAVTVVIAAVCLWSLWSLDRADGLSESSWGGALPLIGIGPLILVELMIFESRGWVEEVAGIDAPLGFAVVMAGNLALLLGVRLGLSGPRRNGLVLAVGSAIYLPLATYYSATPGLLLIGTLILTQLVLGWGWGMICSAAATSESAGLGRTGVSLPLGTLLFLGLAFAFYLALDVALPFPRGWVLPLGALLFGLSTMIAARAARFASEAPSSGPVWVGAALLLVPWVVWLVQGPVPEAVTGTGSVRIMTYNIHSGYGAAGRHNPEQIAQVIEASGADIVALQEVSRVRLLDGGTDLAGWLSRRLGLPVIFRGTEEPIWGNAILSRFPILESGWDDLPREGALIGRGYLWAKIDVGFPLLVINAHLHHIEEDHQIRLVEVPALLDFWNGRPTTILLGDLNSEPDYPEMALPPAAGLVDSWSEAGAGVGFTWSAAAPGKRIDWIWHSSDLQAAQIEVISSQASDHLPVVAEIRQAP